MKGRLHKKQSKGSGTPAKTAASDSSIAFRPPPQFRRINEKGAAQQTAHTAGAVQCVFSVQEDDKTITFSNEDDLKKYHLFQKEDTETRKAIIQLFNENDDYGKLTWWGLLLKASDIVNIAKENDVKKETKKFRKEDKKRNRESFDLDDYKERQQKNAKQKLDKIKNPDNLTTENVKKFLQVGKNHCWASVSYALHCHYGGSYENIGEFVFHHAANENITKFKNDEAADIDMAAGSFSGRDFFTAIEMDMPVKVSEFELETQKNQPVIANVGNHYILIRSIRKNKNQYEMIVMDPAEGNDQVMKVSTRKQKNTDIVKVVKVGNYKLQQVYFTASKYTN